MRVIPVLHTLYSVVIQVRHTYVTLVSNCCIVHSKSVTEKTFYLSTCMKFLAVDQWFPSLMPLALPSLKDSGLNSCSQGNAPILILHVLRFLKEK